jgi:hypothetical protein
MAEQPSRSLLDRHKAARDVQERFGEQLDALEDMVNYGSRLVHETYEGSGKTPVDVVVLGVLLKQIVAMADSVLVQLREGIVRPAFLPTRAALEALLYLEWILIGDAKFKVNCYIVANMRHESLWAGRDRQPSAEARAFGRVAAEIGMEHKATSRLPESFAELDPDKTYQSLTVDSPAGPGRDQERRSQSRAQWFNLAGASSLRRIAQQVGRLAQYHFEYAQGAHISHHALYKDHVQVEGHEVHLREIRDTADAGELLQSMMQVLLGAFVSVLKHYRPGELRTFGATYAERWRGQFLATHRPPATR